MSYIDREALLSEFVRAQNMMYRLGYEYACSFMSPSQEVSTEWHCVEGMVENMPFADVKPVRHATWVCRENGQCYWFECSNCGKEPLFDGYGNRDFSHNCPSCGARMDMDEVSEYER